MKTISPATTRTRRAVSRWAVALTDSSMSIKKLGAQRTVSVGSD